MADTPKCTRCSGPIQGNIKIDTYRKRLGQKSLNKVDYYCTECFSKVNYERSWNEHKRKEAINKRQSGRRVR